MENNNSNKNLWVRIAQVAGAFAFIISMLLIVNYVQYKRIDPVETKLINSLVDRLNKTPDDSQLREEIRTLDLLARKAYFTNQWQLRTGGYLLLISIAVLVIAMQIIKSNSEKEITPSEKEDSFLEQKKARKWVAIVGLGIVGIALSFAYLMHNELSTELTIAALPEVDSDVSQNKHITNNKPVYEETVVVNPKAISENNNQPEKVEEKKTESIVEKPVVKPKPIKKEVKQIIVEPEKKLSDFPSDYEIKKNHPTFRGPGGNGISYHKNIPVHWDGTSGDNILWKIEIPLHGYNSPVIWEDKIFLSGATADKREVYCINRNTGATIWTAEVKDIPGSPAKSPKVTDDTGLAAPTLATDGQRVFAIFGNGDLATFDMDGKQIWTKNMGDAGNHYGHSSSLMLFQNVLIVQYDSKITPRLIGLNTKTGETIWETPRKVKVSWASPLVVNTGNQTEILIAAEPIVASYNPLTGAENWQVDCIFGEVGPSVAFADGVVYAVNEYAKLVAIKVGETPEIIWESDEYLSDVPSPVATKELLFMATSYGVVICYNAKTGEINWEHEFDNGFYSSPMLVEGKIYLIDMQGIMRVFAAEKEFVSIGESPLGEKCMTTPSFSEGKIYIRGNNHLFCIGN